MYMSKFYIYIYILFFFRAVSKCVTLLSRAFKGKFVIPEFEHFSKQITDIYNSCKSNEAGQVSTYYYVFIIQKNFAPKKLTTKIAHTQN